MFSSLTFHVMRDHPYHGLDILGGMFGIAQSSPASKEERSKEFNEMISKYGSQWKKGRDQVPISPTFYTQLLRAQIQKAQKAT